MGVRVGRGGCESGEGYTVRVREGYMVRVG